MLKIFLLIFVNFHQFFAIQICIYIDIIISILMRYKLLFINFFVSRDVNASILTYYIYYIDIIIKSIFLVKVFTCKSFK